MSGENPRKGLFVTSGNRVCNPEEAEGITEKEGGMMWMNEGGMGCWKSVRVRGVGGTPAGWILTVIECKAVVLNLFSHGPLE